MLCTVGLGESIRLAQQAAYEAADRVQFEGKQLRRDIGWRELDRKLSKAKAIRG